MIQRVIVLAAMMVTTVEKLKTVVCSIDGALADGEETRPRQQTGRSHVTIV